MSNLGTVFEQAEAVYRARVEVETFGHLAPEARKPYHGHMLFAFGCFGDHQVIDYDFEELPSSPWLCRDIYDFIDKLIQDDKIERGGLYKFEGHYIKFKNGGYAFRGVTNVVKVDYARRVG